MRFSLCNFSTETLQGRQNPQIPRSSSCPHSSEESRIRKFSKADKLLILSTWLSPQITSPERFYCLRPFLSISPLCWRKSRSTLKRTSSSSRSKFRSSCPSVSPWKQVTVRCANATHILPDRLRPRLTCTCTATTTTLRPSNLTFKLAMNTRRHVYGRERIQSSCL